MKFGCAIPCTLLAACAIAQQAGTPDAIKVPEMLGRGLGMPVTAYTGRPADLTLIPHGDAARHGKIWLQNIGEGLLIVGEVEGATPDFPASDNQILGKDHIEVWLADGNDPELPAIGWGNQFNQVVLPNGADSCGEWATKQAGDTPAAPSAAGAEKRCRAWAEKQIPYRTYLARLFVRQWLVAPDHSVESFARPAFDQIAARFVGDRQSNSVPTDDQAPTPLEPLGQLQTRFGPGANHAGYTFEILIPYSAFPPISTTALRDVRLMVDVFNAPPAGKTVGAYSTTAPARVWAKPASFNHLALDPPQQFHLTPCDLPLAGTDKYGDMHPGWFIPKAAQDAEFESDAFVLVNDGAGYQYEPENLSPVARPIHYFWHGIGGSEYVCGPYLSYRRGDEKLDFDIGVDHDGFDAHRLPGGDLLIKVGPRVYGSEFGSGQCGACPRTDLRIYRLGPDFKPKEMLALSDVVDTGSGVSQDFSVSRDWSKVVQYDQAAMDEQGKPGAWSSTTWCRGESAYRKCDHQDTADPPDPPVLKELRNAD